MIFLIGLLTVVLVVNCLMLILLVLIQLPKKEAGAGLAFGGAATDALFGAGSGNVLTKATKYATISFFVLLLIIGLAQNKVFKPDAKDFKSAVEEAAKAPAAVTPPVATPTPASGATPAISSLTNLQSATLSNAPAVSPATSAPSATP